MLLRMQPNGVIACSRATLKSRRSSIRLPGRIRAHKLICFLALLLHRTLRQRIKALVRPHSLGTALELLRRFQQHRATLGERSSNTGTRKMT